MKRLSKLLRLTSATVALTFLVTSSTAFAASAIPPLSQLGDDATCQAKLVANAKNYDGDDLRSYLKKRVATRDNTLSNTINGPKGLLTVAQKNYNAYAAKAQTISSRIDQINSIKTKSLNGLTANPAYDYTIANVTPRQADLTKVNQDNANARQIIDIANQRLADSGATRYALARSICASVYGAQIFSLVHPEARQQYIQTRIDGLQLNNGINQALYNSVKSVYEAKKAANAEYDADGTIAAQVAAMPDPSTSTTQLVAKTQLISNTLANPNAWHTKPQSDKLTEISRQINTQKDALIPVFNKTMTTKLPKTKKTVTKTTTKQKTNGTGGASAPKTTTQKTTGSKGSGGASPSSGGGSKSTGSSGGSSSSGSSKSSKKSGSDSSSSSKSSKKTSDSVAAAKKKKAAADAELRKANREVKQAHQKVIEINKQIKELQSAGGGSPAQREQLAALRQERDKAVEAQNQARINQAGATSVQRHQAQKYADAKERDSAIKAGGVTAARYTKKEADANLREANRDVAAANKKAQKTSKDLAYWEKEYAKSTKNGASSPDAKFFLDEAKKENAKAQAAKKAALINQAGATSAQRHQAEKLAAAKKKEVANGSGVAAARSSKAAADSNLHKANHEVSLANKEVTKAQKDIKEANREYNAAKKAGQDTTQQEKKLTAASKTLEQARNDRKVALTNQAGATSAQRHQAEKLATAKKKEAAAKKAAEEKAIADRINAQSSPKAKWNQAHKEGKKHPNATCTKVGPFAIKCKYF